MDQEFPAVENKLILFHVVRPAKGDSHYEAYEIKRLSDDSPYCNIRYGAEKYNVVTGLKPFVGIDLKEMARVLWRERAHRSLLLRKLPTFLAFDEEKYAADTENSSVLQIRFATCREIYQVFSYIDRIDKQMFKKVFLN